MTQSGNWNGRLRIALMAGLFAATSAGQAQTEDVGAFYAGKTINMVVGHEAGTGFDIYTRVINRHMGRHVPGNPAIIVQNMPGASGVQSANWLYSIAPRDGTVVATFSQNVPLEPMFGNTRAKFDPAQFIWIGNAESSVTVCGVTPRSGIKTFAELQQREIIFGATGPTGPLVKSARAVKNLMGAKINIVTGYKGSASVRSAMLTGEVHGICGLPWSTIKSFWKAEIESGDFITIIQLSGDPMPEFGKIPHANDFIKSEADRQLFDLLFNVQVLGRAYTLPPGVPQARVDALRKAFMDTMRDPKFLEEAEKAGLDISPAPGDAVGELWKRFASTPKEVVERAAQVTEQ